MPNTTTATATLDTPKPVDSTAFPTFPATSTSLLSKHLTLSLFASLQTTTDIHGNTLSTIIRSGLLNPGSAIGVYAPSVDSYTSFARLFHPIVTSYHSHTPPAPHPTNLDPRALRCPPVSPPAVVSTRMRVSRNFADLPFGSVITAPQRAQLESRVVHALSTLDGDLAGEYYSLADMTEPQRHQLVQDHFLFRGGDKYLAAAGLERDWPLSRGIFHNHAKTFLVWVNEEDHLRIVSMQPGFDVVQVFDRLSRALGALERVLPFAFDDSLGFLSSCPTNLGTGLRASVHIRLPVLKKRKDVLDRIVGEYKLQIRGVHGEHTDDGGDLMDVSNARRLGKTEVELVQGLYDGVNALLQAEQQCALGDGVNGTPDLV